VTTEATFLLSARRAVKVLVVWRRERRMSSLLSSLLQSTDSTNVRIRNTFSSGLRVSYKKWFTQKLISSCFYLFEQSDTYF